MRISLDWLQEWVDVRLAPRELADRLTMSGFEVEAIEAAAPPLEGVVVGEVTRCERHPNADTLSLCRVNAGPGADALQIVCGAPNVRKGMKVAVARIGARLPGGLEIKAAMLRGVESQGMLCSGRELGLGEDGDGILDLPAELVVGTPLSKALKLDDTVLTVNVTPNRGDCMSVLGIAREAAAISGSHVRGTAVESVAAGGKSSLPIELTSGAGCERFVSRVIRGVRAEATSPAWLQERLRRAGLRPINAIVDVTNYVMLDVGQPLHAYDLGEIAGGIVVRRARGGEMLRLLDGREIAMDEDVLVIADHEKPLGLAGIMGGDHSGIGPETTDVLLEVAFFDPAVVAGRGRRYGLVTDASQRFERGVDPTGQERAIERATALLLAHAGGVAGPTQVTEVAPRRAAAASVPLRPERARMVIGAVIEDAQMQQFLRSLGMHVDARESTWQVTPPSWRFDIAIEEDLIEEVARLYGFENVPETPLAIRSTMRPVTEHRVPTARLADTLADRGYFEAVTYSFVDPALQRRFDPDGVQLELSNPIAADLAVMRTSLWPGLVRATAENQRRQQPRVRLFEMATKFVTVDGTLHEIPCIAGVASGAVLPKQWGERERPVDYFDVRADIEALLVGTRASDEFRWVAAVHPALHPGQTARLLRGDRSVGWLGRLHPEIERVLDLTYSAVVFELETEPAFASAVPEHRELSRFPAVRRDIAVVLDAAVPVAGVLDQARRSAGPLATDVEIFDIYQGPGIGSGLKSVAIGLNLQDVSRTLTDDDADAVVAQVVADLKREFDATIRDK
jgi:phenylalanyl-tRNA synthetase beta chain